MCFDVKQGCEPNAECGFELMVESINRITNDAVCIGAPLDHTWAFEGVDMGICKHYSKFPVVWNNLYQSWNIALVSNII